MAVEGSIQPVELRIRRDSHGNWRIEGGGVNGAISQIGRTLENTLAGVVARTVDHPFDVRGLAGAIELILGVKEAS